MNSETQASPVCILFRQGKTETVQKELLRTNLLHACDEAVCLSVSRCYLKINKAK